MECQAIAIGQMAMRLDDFLDLTPGEFQDAYTSFLEAEQSKFRTNWEIARWQVFQTLCPPNKKQIAITDLAKFPWEKENKNTTKIKPSTPERFNKLKEKFR